MKELVGIDILKVKDKIENEIKKTFVNNKLTVLDCGVVLKKLYYEIMLGIDIEHHLKTIEKLKKKIKELEK